MDPNQQPSQPSPQPAAPTPSGQSFPAPPPNNLQPNQYDFITNPPKPSQPRLLASLKKSNIIVIVGVGLVVCMLIYAIASLVFGGTDDRTTVLPVLRAQNEIIATADKGVDKSGGNLAKGLAVSVQQTVTTQHLEVLAQVQTKKKKIKTKEYAQGVSSKTAAELTTAENNSRFDEVFIIAIKAKLTQYQQTLKTARAQAKSSRLQQLLAKDYEDTSLLIETPTAATTQ